MVLTDNCNLKVGKTTTGLPYIKHLTHFITGIVTNKKKTKLLSFTIKIPLKSNDIKA